MATDRQPQDDETTPRDDAVAREDRRRLLDRILDEELPRYAEALRRLGQ